MAVIYNGKEITWADFSPEKLAIITQINIRAAERRWERLNVATQNTLEGKDSASIQKTHEQETQ